MHFSVDAKTACVLRESGLSVRRGSVHMRYMPGEFYRYSPVVSKRQGCAAERNRIKRITREILRKNAGKNPKGSYLVFLRGECSALNRTVIERDIGILMNIIHETAR